MAVRESRRIEYINVMLRKATLLRKVEVSQLGLKLELSIEAASECYQIATSAEQKPNIRTLTHLLPRKTSDPLVLGFKHKTRDNMVTHTIRFPVEIIECAIRMQAKQGVAVLVQRLRQLLTDLQPIKDSRLLSGRSRRLGVYNATDLIAAARHHAREWGFNAKGLIKAYAELGVQDSALMQYPQMAPPSPPSPVAPPMLPFMEDPPELLIHYNDFMSYDDHSHPPITWDWVLPAFPTAACDDEVHSHDDANDDDDDVEQQQQFYPAAVFQSWDQLESQQSDDVWLGSLNDEICTQLNEEQLEPLDWLDELQLSDLP